MSALNKIYILDAIEQFFSHFCISALLYYLVK